MPESAKKSLIIFIYLALALSTLLVFWQVWDFDFVNYDDTEYVFQNPHVLGGLTLDNIIWAFRTGFAANWHPFTWLSLMLDCQLFSNDPGSMHLVNVLLHLANILLLFEVLKKMTNRIWPSAFVAAAFALHPMHVESVAWIAERKDVLSTLFFMFTLFAYVSYVKRRSVASYILALMLFAIGLMAKPMLVTLPFVLLLLDYWPLDRFLSEPTSGKSVCAPDKRAILLQLIIEKIPFFVLAAISSVITFLVQHSTGAVAGVNALPLASRVANAFLSYARYIGKMFWPQNLAVFYPFNSASIRLWQVVLCVLLLFVFSALVVYIGRKHKYLLVGWFWFVGTLIPVIGFVQVGSQAFADRYTYIPYIGLFIIIAWGLPELLSKWPYRKIALGTSMLVVLTALGICAFRQTNYWKNGIMLFSHALEVTQDNYLAHYNLGYELQQNGEVALASEHYKKALDIAPRYFDACNNLAGILIWQGRNREALGYIKRTLEIEPDNPAAKNNLAWMLATSPDSNIRNPSEAIRLAQEACSITNYKDPGMLDTLGVAYASAGRFAEAIKISQNALDLIGTAHQQQINNIIQGHLNLYEQGKPYIEPAPRAF